MTKRAKREISLFQYILTISGVQVGFGVLTLPREVAQGANTDGWMSIIIGCAITTLVSLCIVKIMEKHPGYHLLDVLTRYLGKWLGRVGMIFWVLYAVLAAVSLIFSLLYVIHIWILPRSPMFLIMMLLSIPMVMLSCKGVLIISRYAVFTVLFTLWMPLLLFIPLKDGHWVYLLPLLKEGWIPVFNTVKSTIIAFLGFEFAFILYPYLSNKSFAKKGIVIANMITLLVYLQVTFVSFLYFSPDGITKFLWPTLSLVTPFHEFHRQTFNKGITPAISEIKKRKKDVIVTGSALLTSRGIYKMSLNRYESALLLMLQKKANIPVSLTLKIPSHSVESNSHRKDTEGDDFVTINVLNMNRDIHTGYSDNQFKFNIAMDFKVSVSELTFNMVSIKIERN